MTNTRPLAPLPEPVSDQDELTQLRIHRRDRLGGLLHNTNMPPDQPGRKFSAGTWLTLGLAAHLLGVAVPLAVPR